MIKAKPVSKPVSLFICSPDYYFKTDQENGEPVLNVFIMSKNDRKPLGCEVF